MTNTSNKDFVPPKCIHAHAVNCKKWSKNVMRYEKAPSIYIFIFQRKSSPGRVASAVHACVYSGCSVSISGFSLSRFFATTILPVNYVRTRTTRPRVTRSRPIVPSRAAAAAAALSLTLRREKVRRAIHIYIRVALIARKWLENLAGYSNRPACYPRRMRARGRAVVLLISPRSAAARISSY